MHRKRTITGIRTNDLLIAKLEAYGFSLISLKLIFSYLTNRKQRVTLGSAFTDYLCILFGVPQGSILGPLLFNIFLNDLLLMVSETELCNFADDNTLYVSDNSLDNILLRLNKEIKNTLNWFSNNSMVANPDKFHLMFLGLKNNYNELSVKIGNEKICASKEIKLLGVTIDNDLKFKSHIQNLCAKANNKTCALRRIRSHLPLNKAKIIFNSYILSNFSYCPLIWMFCNKKENNIINNTHKRALRILYNRPDLSLTELLDIDDSHSVHTLNLQKLMIEVFKSLYKLNPEFMWNMFTLKELSYKLRSSKLLCLPSSQLCNNSTNSIVYRASSLWNSLDESVMSENDLNKFKNKIKDWKGEKCICKICC